MINSVIIIPIYKRLIELTNNEKLSLNRTIEIFANEDVILLIRESINRDEYNSEFSQNFKYIIIPDFHFYDINSYSKLLMSSFFYSLFSKYTWMLICQLDAFVFRNDLITFTKRKDFFFVGAPVIDADLKGWENISWVGNGGFSLRRVDLCFNSIKKLEIISRINKILNLEKDSFLSFLNRLILNKLFNLKFNKYLTRYLCETPVNEDVFWGLWVPSFFSYLKPADINTATKFSFEVSPELIYQNVNCLPMGCHAWEKYNPDFWKKFIQ